jgi:hypothetical protein
MNVLHYTAPLLLVSLLLCNPAAGTEFVSLEDAVLRAQGYDVWQQGSLLKQRSLETASIAAGALPNPQVSLGFANLPIDSYDFDQEAMTQFKVGVSQMFPRGQSLELRQQRLAILGAEQPQLRAERRARVAVVVSQLWLDAYLAKRTVQRIEDDRELFEYLVDVVQSNYSSTTDKTRQQDFIRAQLELTRLDDRLALLRQQQETALSALAEWLGSDDYVATATDWLLATALAPVKIDDSAASIPLRHDSVLLEPGSLDPVWLAQQLLLHPAIQGLDQRIDAEFVGVAIAEQKYKPQWGVNASYGYRDDAPDGMQRDDFFSVGVTFDLPIFTAQRQDKAVQSAQSLAESIKTDKWLALRSMRARLEMFRGQLLRLNQRRALYRDHLLLQIHDQAEASLSAYASDGGDFSEVVRARIAELNANIDAMALDVERLKLIAQLNYFFPNDTLGGLAANEVSP